MTSFVNAVIHQDTTTTNGMRARQSTANANVDYFFRAPASRGRDILPLFMAAFVEDRAIALRITQWMRDARGGAGERQLFRNVLVFLATYDITAARALMHKIPEIGRWDDLLVIEGPLQAEAYALIVTALRAGNRLCAKWMPRQGAKATQLRMVMGLSAKQWRKTLVQLTHVVEQQMCAREWDAIAFEHVPGVASARYRKAFDRHTRNFAAYVHNLSLGKQHIHADVVYPYDVLKQLNLSTMSASEIAHVVAQWQALPNFIDDASILPMVDVSGSMMSPVSATLTRMDVAVSLGLYMADKNSGPFKDTFLTFSTEPQLMHLEGNIIEKMVQMQRSHWTMSTNLAGALDVVLLTAVTHGVPQADMPRMLLILSDMQFNAHYMLTSPSIQMNSLSVLELIAAKYAAAGYEMPFVVFWNLDGSYHNVPVVFDATGVAMVSGFSPAILKAIVGGTLAEMTPQAVMLRTVMIERYAV
jgi:hypothetical protein